MGNAYVKTSERPWTTIININQRCSLICIHLLIRFPVFDPYCALYCLPPGPRRPTPTCLKLISTMRRQRTTQGIASMAEEIGMFANISVGCRAEVMPDAYLLCTRALRRTANLEQLRALPLAPPATNDIDSTLLACVVCTFLCASSGINATTFPLLIRLFTRLPPGSRRISYDLRSLVLECSTNLKAQHAT